MTQNPSWRGNGTILEGLIAILTELSRNYPKMYTFEELLDGNESLTKEVVIEQLEPVRGIGFNIEG